MGKTKVKGIIVQIGGDTVGLDKALEGVNKKVGSTQSQLKEVERLLKLDPTNTKLLEQKQRLLAESISESREKMELLTQASKKANGQLDKPIGQEALDALQREIIETENKMKSLQQASSTNLDKLGDALDDTKKKMEDLGKAASEVKDKAGKVADTFEPATKAVLGVAAAAAATVPATQELREELARLDTNAMENGLAVDTVREAWKTFAVQSGDTGASVEAVSNLLQTGFTESDLQKAVEGLAGAAQRFPDTLKVESLADGLQETLATQNATGAFAELMERLGMDTEAFNAALGECTDQQERLDLALQVLADAGLADSYNAWKTNNEELVKNKEAQLEMELAMAGFAETVLPYVTRAIEMVTQLMERFNGLPEPIKFAIAALALLVGGIAPAANAISGASSLIAKLSGGSLPGLGSALSSIGTKVLPALGNAFSSVFGFIAANPVVLLITAIVGLVATIATKGDEIQAKLQDVDDYMQNVFAKDWTETLGPGLGGAMNIFSDTCKGHWDATMTTMNGVIDFIRGVFTLDWKRAWNGLKEICLGVLGGVEASINGVIGLINGLIDAINTICGTEWKKLDKLTLISGSYDKVESGPSDTEDPDGTTPDGTTPLTLTDVGGYANDLEATMLPGVMTQLDPDTQGAALTDYQTQKSSLNTTAQYYYNQSRSTGSINVNVYGTQGQDVQELAELVSQELQIMLDQEEGGLR